MTTTEAPSAFPRAYRPAPPPAVTSGHPGWPSFPIGTAYRKDTEMPSKPKPETDDAVEQAKRALQTSMDTRQ
jgi:hypothetical protein